MQYEYNVYVEDLRALATNIDRVVGRHPDGLSSGRTAVVEYDIPLTRDEKDLLDAFMATPNPDQIPPPPGTVISIGNILANHREIQAAVGVPMRVYSNDDGGWEVYFDRTLTASEETAFRREMDELIVRTISR